MYVWDIESSSIRTILECAADIKGGRLRDDRNSSKNSTKNKYFNSVCISPCGKYVLGGGNSKNVCVYDLGSRVLIRRFALTQNRQLDGVLTKLNSKNIKEGVLDHEIDSDLSEDAYELRNKADLTLPGAKRQNNATIIKRNTKLAIRIKMCKFSSDGSQFACATTEGLVIYSLAKDLCFAPFELSEEVTIDNIVAQIKAENYLTALLLALRMNDAHVLDSVFKCVPIQSAELICSQIPENYIIRVLDLLLVQTEARGNLEWTQVWLRQILRYHERFLQSCRQSTDYVSTAYAASRSVKETEGRAVLLKVHAALSFHEDNLR